MDSPHGLDRGPVGGDLHQQQPDDDDRRVTPAEPENTKLKFNTTPRKAKLPVNSPRIKQIPMTSSPTATSLAIHTALSDSHPRKLTHQSYGVSLGYHPLRVMLRADRRPKMAGVACRACSPACPG